MPKLVEYQDGEVDVKSRNPLRGTLVLVDDEDHDVDLELDKDRKYEPASAYPAQANIESRHRTRSQGTP
ncbi:MAG: hypothetical protein E5Y62_32010, partial [Mesorhizobium sp.]